MVNCAAGHYSPMKRLPRWDVSGAWDVPGCADVPGAWDAPRRRYSSSKAPV